MLNKLINAWNDSHRVVEHRRVIRGAAERLVWNGHGWTEARFNGRRTAPTSSWL